MTLYIAVHLNQIVHMTYTRNTPIHGISIFHSFTCKYLSQNSKDHSMGHISRAPHVVFYTNSNQAHKSG